MYTADITSIQTLNTVTGQPIYRKMDIKGTEMDIAQAIITFKHNKEVKTAWIPASLLKEDHNQVHFTLETEFKAVKDSSRTKGEVLGDKCPEGKENEPLYFEGETVKRETPRVIVSSTSKRQAIAMSLVDKIELLKAQGLEHLIGEMIAKS